MATATTAGRLSRVWATPAGLGAWFTTVDHKEIGRRYVVTAFLFFLLGGVLAMAMRTQLARPDSTVLSPETYDQFFTMHGTTMIFLFATPIQSGLANFLIPLMIGSRDMAFPRLNALSYWVFLFAGAFMWSSFLFGAAPDGGWFNYVPLTEATYTPGLNIDFWTLGLIFLAISTTAGAINFIVTIFKLRAPGMSINRMPLFVWNMLATSFAIVFALPALTTANILLSLDRLAGTHFFDAIDGGNVLLWQHLFWVFGHPDVYIIFLPAVGMVSMVVSTFASRPVVGYTYIAMATVATAIIAFGVWVHHMFATGLPQVALTFFAAASLTIAIPSGIQVIAWITTMFRGRVRWQTPMLFILGFLIIFTIGGMSGVMFGAVPFDQQVTDSYFVVAHFHYVLIGGAVFPIFAGLHYWFPKMTGRMLREWLGWVTFWLMFIGFNLAFFPMHISGLLGMPRRVYTYPPGLGWDLPNLLSTIGAWVLGLGVLAFMINVVWSRASGRLAEPDPWGAGTLEWATSSPPPVYNFASIPIVTGRYPLWEEGSESSDLRLDQRRVTLASSVLDAAPSGLATMPEDSIWPLILALGLAATFIGLLLTSWVIGVIGVLVTAFAIAAWLWPTEEQYA